MLIKIIRILLICLFIIFPFGQLTKIPGLPETINLYLHDIIITLALYLWTFTKPRVKSNLITPLIYFLSASLFSLILATKHFPLSQIFVASLYLFRFSVYSCLIFILQDKRLKINLKKLLTYSSLALGILGLLQYLFLPDMRFMAINLWDDHYYRVISTFLDPSFVGMILVFGIILVITAQSSPWLYPLYFIPLLLTYSRSSYLALLSSLIAYVIYQKKYKLLLFGLLFVCLLPLLPRPGGEGVKLERVFSINQRIDNYQDSFKIIKAHPLIGVGFNTLRFYQKQPLSHAGAGLDSSLLFVLATTGIIGFVAYINFLKHLFNTSLLIKISLIALLVHSLFQNSLFYPWVLIWFFGLVAMECN